MGGGQSKEVGEWVGGGVTHDTIPNTDKHKHSTRRARRKAKTQKKQNTHKKTYKLYRTLVKGGDRKINRF